MISLEHVLDAERHDLQDDRGQAGPEDLGHGLRRQAVELLPGEHPVAVAGGVAPGPPGALQGLRLGGQHHPEHVQARARLVGPGAKKMAKRTFIVSRRSVSVWGKVSSRLIHLLSLDPSGVDDVLDARDGQRSLGDVGGHDHLVQINAC